MRLKHWFKVHQLHQPDFAVSALARIDCNSWALRLFGRVRARPARVPGTRQKHRKMWGRELRKLAEVDLDKAVSDNGVRVHKAEAALDKAVSALVAAKKNLVAANETLEKPKKRRRW